MKRIIIISILIALLSLALYSQSASITDFLQPVSAAQKFYGTLNLNYSGTNFMSANGLLNLTYYKFYSSLPYSYSINATINNNYANTMNIDNVVTIKENGLIHPLIQADIQKYIFGKSDFFLAGTGYLEYQKSIQDRGGMLKTIFGPGAGFGRIVVATAMAQALRIEEYLLSEKLITGEFKKDITLEIASHCSKLNEYATKYGDKHPIDWYMDLEKILIKSGKLVNNSISPYSLFRIEEILHRERIYDRNIGWRFTGYINYNYNVEIPNPYNTRLADQYGTTLKVEIGYPINNKLQFNHYTQYDYSSTFNNSFTSFSNNLINSNTTLSYKFSNLIDFILGYSIHYNSYISIPQMLFKNQTLSFDFYYYIENNVFLQFSAELEHNYRSGLNPVTNNVDEMYKHISLNIGYRFF